MTTREIMFAAGGNIQYVGNTKFIQFDVGTSTVSLTSLSGGIGSAPQTGDIVVVLMGIASQGLPTESFVTSGYTIIDSRFINSVRDANIRVAYKIMGAVPDTNFQASQTEIADGGGIIIHVFRGVSRYNPINAITTSSNANSAAPIPPAITPTSSGAVIIVFGISAVTGSGWLFSTSGLSNFITFDNQETNTPVLGAGWAKWVGGTFTPAAFTINKPDSSDFSYAAATVALRPA